MAVQAHLITMGLKPALNKNIRAWFHQSNFLPPLPMAAAHIDTVHDHSSLEDLLKRMIESTYKSFILIIHGYDDGSGLYLNLAPGQTKLHTTHDDLQKLMDVDSGVSTMSHKDMMTMGITKAHIDRLLDLMHRVRAKKIDCIEFRSCNLGKNTLSLQRFRQFFGARLLGAPNLHTVFGITPVMIRPDFDKAHRHFHPGKNWETYNFPNQFTDPDLVCCFQLNELQKPESGGHVATGSPATLNAWVKQWITPDGPPGHNYMAMHALWIADKKVSGPHGKSRFVPVAIAFEEADFKDPLGGWGGPPVRRFIPPLSENYAKHIVYSR